MPEDTQESQPAMVTSNKRSFSKKQKIYGTVIAVVALTLLGSGGYMLWQKTSANAEGSKDLTAIKSYIKSDSAAPAVSEYFEVNALGQQDIGFNIKGQACDAISNTNTSPNDYCKLLPDWRIERLVQTAAGAKWEVAADSNTQPKYWSQDSEPYSVQSVMDSHSITASSTYESGVSPPDQSDALRSKMANPLSLQPTTSYSYRISKSINGQWTPQEPVINVSTLAYPSISAALKSSTSVNIKADKGDALPNKVRGLTRFHQDSYYLLGLSNPANQFDVVESSALSPNTPLDWYRLTPTTDAAQKANSIVYYTIATSNSDRRFMLLTKPVPVSTGESKNDFVSDVKLSKTAFQTGDDILANNTLSYNVLNRIPGETLKYIDIQAIKNKSTECSPWVSSLAFGANPNTAKFGNGCTFYTPGKKRLNITFVSRSGVNNEVLRQHQTSVEISVSKSTPKFHRGQIYGWIEYKNRPRISINPPSFASSACSATLNNFYASVGVFVLKYRSNNAEIGRMSAHCGKVNKLGRTPSILLSAKRGATYKLKMTYIPRDNYEVFTSKTFNLPDIRFPDKKDYLENIFYDG
jgi:hypothetical protein